MAKIMIDEILFDPTSNEAIREGKRLRLEHKVMQTLMILVQHAQKTVTNEEILKQVWPELVVTQDSISQCVSKLRQIFDDNPTQPRVIETIPKKGYRLIAPVHFVDPKAQPIQNKEPNDSAANPKTVAGILSVIAFLVSSLILYGSALGWGKGVGIVIGIATLVYVFAYIGSVKFHMRK